MWKKLHHTVFGQNWYAPVQQTGKLCLTRWGQFSQSFLASFLRVGFQSFLLGKKNDVTWHSAQVSQEGCGSKRNVSKMKPERTAAEITNLTVIWDKKENISVRRLSHKSIRTNFSFLLCLSYLLSKRMKYVKQVINKIWPWNGIHLLNAKLLTCTIYVVYFEVEYSKISDHLSEFITSHIV